MIRFKQWLVENETIRLYRAEYSPKQSTLPSWITQAQDYQGTAQASGRWFTDDPEEAMWYLHNQYPDGDGRIMFVDVPRMEAERYRVSNTAAKTDFNAADNPQRYSRRPDKEFFLPPEIAANKRPLGNFPPNPDTFQPNPLVGSVSDKRDRSN